MEKSMDKTMHLEAIRKIFKKYKIHKGVLLEKVETLLKNTEYFWADAHGQGGKCKTDAEGCWIDGKEPAEGSVILRLVPTRPHGSKG
jgi:hypothetical protein